MRTKKIISLFCSMAMAISVFAGTIASAGTTEPVAKGINYTIVKNDELEKVYTISYAGVTDGIKGFDVGASFVGSAEDLAKISNVEITSELGITKNWLSDSSFVGIVFASSVPVKPTNNILATVTVTLTADLKGELTLDYSCDYSLTTGSGVQYYMFGAESGFELITNTLTLTKKVSSEPAPEKVTPSQVSNKDGGDVFKAEYKDGTNSAVAAVFDGTTTKAASKLTWKIDATPVDSSRTPKKTTFEYDLAGEINAGATIKVGLIVAYDDAEFSNVTITSLEY